MEEGLKRIRVEGLGFRGMAQGKEVEKSKSRKVKGVEERGNRIMNIE